jgi:hypothetical protein
MSPEALIRLLRELFAPVVRAIDDPSYAPALLRDLGYELPPDVVVLPQLEGAVVALSAAITAIEDLPSNATAADRLALLPAFANAVRALVDTISDIRARVEAAAAGVAFDFSVLDELAARLLEYLLTTALSRHLPAVDTSLRLLGIVEDQLEEQTPTTFHLAYRRARIRWDRIGRAFGDPLGLVGEVYGWGTDTFAFTRLARRAASLGRAFHVPSELVSYTLPFNPGIASVDPAVADSLRTLRIPFLPQIGAGVGVEIYPVVRSDGTAVDGMGIGIYLDPAVGAEIPISDAVTLRIQVTTGGGPPPSVRILPGGQLAFVESVFAAGGLASEYDVRLLFVLERPGQTLLLFGSRGATRLEAKTAEAGVGVAGGTQTDPEVLASLRLGNAALVVDTGDADGFLKSLLPAGSLTLPFDVALGFSTRRGLYIAGSAGLETSIGLHLDLGPIALELLHVRFRAATEGLFLELSTTGSASLGPIGAAVDRVGVDLGLRFQAGNLGPVDLAIGFKPPTGLGLVVDAGPVTGGGYIEFDPPSGRYAGILQLEMFGVGVTAIGVLDTRDAEGMPLPPPGFSFLLIISAEFEGLQLGFGFVLTGVGGLVGIHRAMATEALRGGVRDGSLDHIMFPSDPIRNMPQIISDLRAFFPSANGRFIFGPMARVGWGTPSLFEGEIGVLLEVPSPVVVALIGQLNVALPTEAADIVALHVSILGIIDFGERLLSIDASLYDSRVAIFSVYGDMALRLGWGDRPVFALSIGGLNPHFQPPPRFPVLRRVTVSLGLGDNPRIGFQAYMAVTSNSIQFGAAAEMYAAAGPLNIYGWLRFDALVIFSPFHFEFEFSVGFALRWNEDAIAGISISGLIAGPAPLRIRGEACISILFVDICIGFDISIGEQEDVPLPAKNPWGPLTVAIADAHNWSASLAPDVRSAVTFREPPNPALVLVHPMGFVTLRQRVVPLNCRLEKFGEFRIIGADRFDVKAVRVGTTTVDHTTVKEFFAPGQFEELSNAEKLSRDSFEQMDAGVTVGSTRVAHGAPASARVAELSYKTTIIDKPNLPSRPVDRPAQSRDAQIALSGQGAVAASPLRGTGSRKFADPRRRRLFTLEDESYAIASTRDTGLRLEFGKGLSKTIAYQILEKHLEDHPEDADALQVVPLSEMEPAA